MRVAAGLLACILIVAGCGAGAPADSGGTWMEPPSPLKDFTLTSHQGAPLSLSDLRGKVILLYFGYTFCPDICPTTLVELAKVRRELGAAAADVTVVFISVDPERDTPEVLARYLRPFDEEFIGLVGDTATLRGISSDYGLYYAKQQVAGTSAPYLVDHSAATYLIDRQGRLQVVYSYGTSAAVISAGVRSVLEQRPGRP